MTWHIDVNVICLKGETCMCKCVCLKRYYARVNRPHISICKTEVQWESIVKEIFVEIVSLLILLLFNL